MKSGKIILLLLCFILVISMGCSIKPITQSNSVIENDELNLNSVQAVNGIVTITGLTNLPNNSNITVSFDIAGQKNANTYLGISSDVTVTNGAFTVSIIPPSIQEYTKGNYNVNLLFTPKNQTNNVLKIVGENGEKLSGKNMKTDNNLKFNILKVSKNIKLDLNATVKYT